MSESGTPLLFFWAPMADSLSSRSTMSGPTTSPKILVRLDELVGLLALGL